MYSTPVNHLPRFNLHEKTVLRNLHLYKSTKHPHTVMLSALWIHFVSAGTGNLVRLDEKMIGAKFRAVLEENLLVCQRLKIGVEVHLTLR